MWILREWNGPKVREIIREIHSEDMDVFVVFYIINQWRCISWRQRELKECTCTASGWYYSMCTCVYIKTDDSTACWDGIWSLTLRVVVFLQQCASTEAAGEQFLSLSVCPSVFVQPHKHGPVHVQKLAQESHTCTGTLGKVTMLHIESGTQRTFNLHEWGSRRTLWFCCFLQPCFLPLIYSEL